MRMLQQERVQDWSFLVLREVGEGTGKNKQVVLYIVIHTYFTTCCLKNKCKYLRSELLITSSFSKATIDLEMKHK